MKTDLDEGDLEDGGVEMPESHLVYFYHACVAAGAAPAWMVDAAAAHRDKKRAAEAEAAKAKAKASQKAAVAEESKS